MKKVLAVIMAVLVVLTTCSIAVMAEETDAETNVAVEENTTRNIKNEDGLVVPINFNQLKSSVIFKIFEKIISFILSLFGEQAPEIDQELADAVGGLGDDISNRIEQVYPQS